MLLRTSGEYELIIGSMNWTTSSQANAESGLVIRRPCADHVSRAWASDFEAVMETGITLEECEALPAHRNRTQYPENR